jgi:hypothetical protein
MTLPAFRAAHCVQSRGRGMRTALSFLFLAGFAGPALASEPVDVVRPFYESIGMEYDPASRELFVDDVQPELIGESMEEFEGGRKQIVSFFTLESEMPDEFSLTDVQQLRPMSRAEIETKLEHKPTQFAPTFRRIWEKYSLMIRI